MHAYAEKTQETKNPAVVNEVPQMQIHRESAIQFEDNRPETAQLSALQTMANNSPRSQHLVQLQDMANNHVPQQPIQKKASLEPSRKENNTGLPDNLKSGIENLSGYSMDDVKVHRNSDKPAQLHAHAYAQGTDIHLASGQEKHLPHEAWHVVQQKQGRVKPSIQLKVNENSNPSSFPFSHKTTQSPVQRQPDNESTTKDGGTELLDFIQQLESLEAEASSLGKDDKEAPEMKHLSEILTELQKISNTGDGSTKSNAVNAMRKELAKAAIPNSGNLLGNKKSEGPTIVKAPVQRQVIQRLEIYEIAGIIIGSGIVIGGILAYVRHRRRNRAERQREQGILDRYYNEPEFAGNVVNSTPEQILPPEIINGIATLPNNGAKAARLFANLNAFQFTYLGGRVGAQIAFLAKRGDCQTLRDMYIYAATHLEIPVEQGNRQYEHLVPSSAIHGRNTRGNTENQSHWFFSEHYWVLAAGQVYDLLFRTQALGPHYRYTHTENHNDVSYKVFDNGNCLLAQNQTENLNVNFNSSGLVLASVELMQAYIDEHHN